MHWILPGVLLLAGLSIVILPTSLPAAPAVAAGRSSWIAMAIASAVVVCVVVFALGALKHARDTELAGAQRLPAVGLHPNAGGGEQIGGQVRADQHEHAIDGDDALARGGRERDAVIVDPAHGRAAHDL